MADCRVCGRAMNGDNRLGAMRRTLRRLPLLSDGATIIMESGHIRLFLHQLLVWSNNGLVK